VCACVCVCVCVCACACACVSVSWHRSGNAGPGVLFKFPVAWSNLPENSQEIDQVFSINNLLHSIKSIPESDMLFPYS